MIVPAFSNKESGKYMYDIIVVGGGPAGMTAALYARRNGKTALVIEKQGFGGQITHSPKVENYPGTLSMSGNEFADKMLDQILAQGAEIEIEKVVSITKNDKTLTVETEEGNTYESKAVVIATGVKHRLLGLEREQDFIGEGISFCAVCDGDFYTGKKVCVIGGGNSALQEATLLSDKCSEVVILQDMPYLTGEQSLVDLLSKRDNVKTFVNIKIDSLVIENDEFKGVNVTDKVTNEKKTFLCDGMFVAIGLIPENKPFEHLADLNNWGYFDTDEMCTTKTPGVYVAGDCRSKRIRQVATAISDGATASLFACDYINKNF